MRKRPLSQGSVARRRISDLRVAKPYCDLNRALQWISHRSSLRTPGATAPAEDLPDREYTLLEEESVSSGRSRVREVPFSFTA